MGPDLFMMMLAISVSCVSFGSITATPVLTRDTFEAGDPISEKELSDAIFSKAAGKFQPSPFRFLKFWGD
jgi:hypothetical protein